MILKTEPSLETPWGIGEGKYSLILIALKNQIVENIVEFGSGASTVRLALDFPNAKILSLEQDKLYFKETIKLMSKFNVRNAEVFYGPLNWKLYTPRFYFTYSIRNKMFPVFCDFVLIDGPTESLTLRGREAPLYFIFPYLKIGALIALDDYHRESAKLVLRNWLSTFGESLEIVREYEDLVILEKKSFGKIRRFPSLVSLIDNWSSTIILFWRVYKKKKKIFKDFIKIFLPK